MQKSLEQTVDVETPEQVVFSYTIAGIGSRAAAAILDYLLCILLFVVFLVAVALPLGAFGRLDWKPVWLAAMLVFVQFLIVWGYYVLWEGLADGQTPGKRRMGLRVVQDGGYSVSFAASAVRNLVRIIDLQPAFSYGVGILSAALSSSGKRLGDIVAGTMVVRERVVHLTAPAPTVPAPREGEAAPAVATLLSDDEYALLERFIQRRGALEADRRRTIADGLAARFAPRWPDVVTSSQAFLPRLYEHERAARARGVAARSDTGAAREQHAIVAAGAERWGRFAKMLDDAQRRGLARMSEKEVSAFVAEYRELATDLARLRTATRGREADALFYLSRLVAGGHNLFYRQRQLVGATAWRYMTVTVPREIRRSARPVLLAALLLFGPAAIAYTVVVRRPEAAREFIPPHMLDRAEEGVRRAKTEEGYIPDPQLWRPVMASAIITNNVQVAFVAFAAGITAGVGTVLALVVNGISFGGVLGLYQTKGILGLIVAFVAPHGVLELTAICLAGGAGLLIAQGMLLPGALTRREALVVNGRRAIRLVAGATLLLVVAGTIEGLISPIPYWPLDLKLIVSAMTAVLLVFYLVQGRSGEAEAPLEESGYQLSSPGGA